MCRRSERRDVGLAKVVLSPPCKPRHNTSIPSLVVDAHQSVEVAYVALQLLWSGGRGIVWNNELGLVRHGVVAP